MSTARVDFTRGAAERIARAVRIVEQGSRDQAPLTFDKVDVGGGGSGLRHVEWSGSWLAGQTNTITFKSSARTATALNAFAGVAAGDGWAARSSSTWHLVVANLSVQNGYSTSEIRLLGHNSSGVIQWYSITTCATAAT